MIEIWYNELDPKLAELREDELPREPARTQMLKFIDLSNQPVGRDGDTGEWRRYVVTKCPHCGKQNIHAGVDTMRNIAQRFNPDEKDWLEFGCRDCISKIPEIFSRK